jgi:hypothetical protein
MNQISLQVALTVFKDSTHQEISGQTYLEQDLKISEIVEIIHEQFGEFRDFALTAQRSQDEDT